MTRQALLAMALVASLAACSRQAPPLPAISHAKVEQLIASGKKADRERCDATQQAALKTLADGRRAYFALTDKSADYYWGHDEKTAGNRVMVTIGRHLFAFPHDSIDRRIPGTAPSLFYQLPGMTPLLSLYCDPEKEDKTFISPSRLEVVIKSPGPIKDSINWRSSREKIWRADSLSDKTWSERSIDAALGLETRSRIFGPYKQEVFVPVDDSMRTPDGNSVRIECNDTIANPLFDRILTCSSDFRYKDDVNILIFFRREYLSDWRHIISTTVQDLDDAYRN